MDRRAMLGLSAAALLEAGMYVKDVPGFLRRKPKPTPTPTPPAPSPTATNTPTAIFQEDFSSGDFTRWSSCQWSTSGVDRNDDCQSYNGTSDYSAAVANGGAGHEQAARFELRDGDIPFGSSERTEIADANGTQVVAGDVRRMEWDMFFDSAFSVHASSVWCIPWQWHGSGPTASPPLCLDIDSSDVIRLCNNDSSGLQRTVIGSITKNVWQRWRVDALFHEDSATGWAEVSIDGTVVLARHSRATMIPSEPYNYLKMGLYRDPVNTSTAIVWHDNFTMMRL